MFSEAKQLFCSLLFIDGAEYNTHISLLGGFTLFLLVKKQTISVISIKPVV